MCKQIKLKIRRRNHGEFPDHNGAVSIKAESVTGYFSAVPIHDEGVPGQFVMHPKDNVAGTNDVSANLTASRTYLVIMSYYTLIIH